MLGRAQRPGAHRRFHVLPVRLADFRYFSAQLLDAILDRVLHEDRLAKYARRSVGIAQKWIAAASFEFQPCLSQPGFTGRVQK